MEKVKVIKNTNKVKLWPEECQPLLICFIPR